MQQRIRTYAWEFPVRLTHWLNFLCILVLSYTGYYIGSPFMHAVRTDEYIMGWMRFIHLLAAYVFTMSVIVRIYWGFVGNRYSRWWTLIPHTSRQWSDLFGAVKFYLFVSKKPPYAVGHTALAGITYVFIFLLFLFQIFSGFALHSLSHFHGGIWAALGWMRGIMHLQSIRLYHHLVMYILLAFAVVHVYIGWYLDLKERNGLMGSIFSGYKFVTGREWE